MTPRNGVIECPQYLGGKDGGHRMRLRTKVRAGGKNLNSNETMLAAKKKGLKLKTRVKAGGRNLNSNETIVVAPKSGLKVKTRVKAGGTPRPQHNQTVLATPSRKARANARAKKRA